jgi:serine/threonine protein kinase
MIPRLPGGFSHPMRIGEGAFASVYRVRQEALERWVALKFLYEKNPGKRRELLGEAQTQARLRTDSIPQIYDAFEWRSSVCMVMEWISGVSLATLLNRDPAAGDRLSIAGDFIRALRAIHALGFVHRDLKPENIIITPDRGLFLVDFGFSKNVADMHVSTVAHAKGTPAYMAPELWLKGGNVDLMRADVFSSGKILRLVLAGTPAVEFTDALLTEDPSRRPASGVALCALWEASPWNARGNADWQAMAGALAAERLSSDLLSAAKQLLLAGRQEESYWLLAESIEKNGNNSEAMELMGSFQQRSPRRRWSAVHYAALSAVLIGGLMAAFFAGKKSMESAADEPVPIRPHRSPMLASLGGDQPSIGRAELREDPRRPDRLCGKLLFRKTPHARYIRVDGRAIDRDSAFGAGLNLHWGEHDVSLSDSSGRVYRRETIALLPFQTKVMDAPPPLPGMKGTRP